VKTVKGVYNMWHRSCLDKQLNYVPIL